VSETDHEIRASFRRTADRFDVDPDLSLREVVAREQRDRRRRRVAAVAAAATAVVLVTGVVWRVTSGVDRQPQPLPAPEIGNPVTVLRTFSASSLGLTRALKVAVGPNGHLYVTDRSDTVTEMTEDGQVLHTWGAPGSGPGKLRLVSGAIAVGPDGRVYLSDAGNARVQIFSAHGRPLGQLGRYGRGAGLFLGMDDVVVDAQGEVYVEDGQARRLTKFSSSGAVDWQLGRGIGSDPDLHGFLHLGGVGPGGDLLAANDDAGKLLWIAADGSKVATLGSGVSGNRNAGAGSDVGDFPHGACEVSRGPDGMFFLLSCEDRSGPSHLLSVYDADRRLVGRWTDSPVASAPVFLPDGVGVVVTNTGGLMEVRVGG
jgi:hypothetical protein